jgi:hypothetical protein
MDMRSVGMEANIDQQTKFVNRFAAKIGEFNAKTTLTEGFMK